MAYAASGLTRLSGGGGHSLWHYTTDDTDCHSRVLDISMMLSA